MADQGGGSRATIEFIDESGMAATLTGNASSVSASTDLVTGIGTSVDTLAAQQADLHRMIHDQAIALASARETMESMNSTIQLLSAELTRLSAPAPPPPMYGTPQWLVVTREITSYGSCTNICPCGPYNDGDCNCGAEQTRRSVTITNTYKGQRLVTHAPGTAAETAETKESDARPTLTCTYLWTFVWTPHHCPTSTDTSGCTTTPTAPQTSGWSVGEGW